MVEIIFWISWHDYLCGRFVGQFFQQFIGQIFVIYLLENFDTFLCYSSLASFMIEAALILL